LGTEGVGDIANENTLKNIYVIPLKKKKKKKKKKNLKKK